MEFKNITTVSAELQMLVLTWRNHVDIRTCMYTGSIISQQTHQLWLDNLKEDGSIYVFIAFKDGMAIGITSISSVNISHKTAEWGFYLTPEYLMKKGYGSEMNYHFLNFIFDNFEIAKLTSKVLGTNLPAIKLHKKFGFIEEGLRRQNIVRGE